MKALDILKERLFKLCMPKDGVWISQEELDETSKKLEKTVKDYDEDRLAELEKAILDHYLAESCKFGLFDSRFQVNISIFQIMKMCSEHLKNNKRYV